MSSIFGPNKRLTALLTIAITRVPAYSPYAAGVTAILKTPWKPVTEAIHTTEKPGARGKHNAASQVKAAPPPIA